MTDQIATVSVVIPTAGRPEFLAEALRSVRALEGPDIDLDPIVIDDGADDKTELVAHAHGARYIRTTSHGAAAARNAGLRAASGEFIAFLDDDDSWLPGHIRPHIRAMRRRPEVGAVFGQVVSYDYALQEHTRPWPDPFPAGPTSFARVFAYQPQIGATVIRAAVVDRVGFFDELLLGDEDWDWQLRVALAHEVEFLSVPCVAYRCRPDGQRETDDIEWMRLPYFDRVYWRNVRRAASSRPSWMQVARGFVRVRGRYAAGFLSSAIAHSKDGDHKAARRQLVRGFRASPLHACLWLTREAAARSALLHAVASSSAVRSRP